ncbi:50S ribosomal protein L18e [Candidatus Pacearchaeota archaeon]|nr:50S ribosomal protein L18e [Candidatus Pacearchaeota archaeon]
MAVSKTMISKRIPRKMDSYVVETSMAAKKQKAWQTVAQLVSGPRRNYSSVNLDRINSESEDGDTVIIVGKILGNGDLTKKLRICALYFSDSAINKIKQAKCEAIKLVDEIKKNGSAKGVKLIK